MFWFQNPGGVKKGLDLYLAIPLLIAIDLFWCLLRFYFDVYFDLCLIDLSVWYVQLIDWLSDWCIDSSSSSFVLNPFLSFQVRIIFRSLLSISFMTLLRRFLNNVIDCILNFGDFPSHERSSNERAPFVAGDLRSAYYDATSVHHISTLLPCARENYETFDNNTTNC